MMKRYKHSLSHYKLATGGMGQLIPIANVEVLPGDTLQHATQALIRVSPLVAPVMHPVQVRVHHFFVPHRLVWDGWEDFITGVSEDEVPQSGTGGGRLGDYLGVPPSYTGQVSALPLRAYNLIYNDFYRDQDLQQEIDLGAGALRNCAWEKDYFTTARPWPQKGAAVSIPLGSTANIYSENKPDFGPGVTWSPGQSAQPQEQNADGDWKFDKVYADLGNATTVDVEQLREAFALQRYAEARARYGSRYTEYLAYLGVNSSDQRLQRPEFLGGGKATISFSEVLSTSSGGGTNVGDMAGHGIAAIRTRRYRRYFQEHGTVMSLMSVRPKSMYNNGIHRSWLRRTKEDFWQKELESLGQQEISNAEVYADHADPDDTFGYVDRYREYREHPSTVHAEMRDLLNYWHMGRIFDSEPVLNGDFVKCEPTDRIYADTNTDPLIFNVSNSIQARRLVRKRSM